MSFEKIFENQRGAMNEQQVEIARARIEQGASSTYESLAAQFGVRKEQVYASLWLAGVTRAGGSRSRMTQELEEAICKRRAEGATYMELSVEFGFSRPRINRVLRDAGMTRPRG